MTKYDHVFGAVFLYAMIWLGYCGAITCCVSIACLYKANNWADCFVYAIQSDYCPDRDTFWHDYYGDGFNQLSWQQKLFFLVWHLS